MEALFYRGLVLTAAVGLMGASQRSPNFVVSAPTPEMAAQISRAAETYRRDLAIQWLGSSMPNWAQPCPIEVHVAPHLGAGGATSFMFEHGEVYGWQMTIQGSLERVLDSVLPHEVTHTIFATHFRRPLPRWADEGSCTTVEHQSEKMKQQMMLIEFLRTNRGIPFSRMFVMKEYPRDVMPLYSQGYSLARYLISQGGRRKFLDFLADGMQDDNWTRAMQQHYGYANLAVLQANWLDWVRQGSPAQEFKPQPGPAGTPANVLVSNERRTRPEANLIYRGQDAPLAGPMPGPVDDGRPLAKLVGRTVNMPAEEAGPPATTASAAAGASAAVGKPNQGWHVPKRETIDSDMVESGTESASPPKDSQTTLAAGEPANASQPAISTRQPATGAAEQTGHQVTRPQPVQQSRQIILEWSRR
jgi:hypothetical protein